MRTCVFFSCRSLRNSVTRHLCDLENLGYTPAPRWLSGLNVPLHNFQSQTLQWAIDQEREDGGLYRQLFAPLLDKNGEETKIMYSPFMGVIHNEPQVDVRGGFICDEVGESFFSFLLEIYNIFSLYFQMGLGKV